MNLKNRNVFRSKFVGTGPSSYGKRIYRAEVSQMLRNTGLVCLFWIILIIVCNTVVMIINVIISA